jgi:hypothetical protein
MGGQIEELGIVGDPLGWLIRVLDLTEHGGLPAVVQDLLRHAAECLEGGDVAPKHGRQILAGDEPGPHQAAVAEHDREQPDDPLDVRLVGEHGLEEGEIHLGLLAGWGLKPALELNPGLGPDRAQEILQHRIAALVAERADVPEQAPAAEFREGLEALSQVGLVGADEGLPRWPGRVGRRLQSLGDVLADGLAIQAGPARDCRHAQTLAGEIENHDEFPKCDHPRPPSIN